MGQHLNIFIFVFLSSIEMPLLFQGIRRQKVQADQHTMLVQVLEMKGQACAKNCTHDAKKSEPAYFLPFFGGGGGWGGGGVHRVAMLLFGSTVHLHGMTPPVEILNPCAWYQQ
jgi:hypothetical protein